jgi:CRP/FNR family cyclic AMP-dependent transcriptional regulator
VHRFDAWRGMPDVPAQTPTAWCTARHARKVPGHAGEKARPAMNEQSVTRALDTLGDLPLFRGLTVQQVAQVTALLHRKVFSANAAIISAEQPGETVYLLLTGTLRVQIERENGDSAILAMLGPGEIVGEMSAVDSLGRSASVITQEDCIVYWIDRDNFWSCLRSMPELMRNLAAILSRRLRMANAQILALGTLDVYGRVARQILNFAQEYGVATEHGDLCIPLRLTQSDFASMIGASRARVNQVLVSFKRRKFISVDVHYRITVHDRTALARCCG